MLEASDCRRVALMFPKIFAELAGFAIWPTFGDFCSRELDYDISRFDAGKVIGEMCADAKRRYAFAFSVVIEGYRAVNIEGIAENDLFCRRVDLQ